MNRNGVRNVSQGYLVCTHAIGQRKRHYYLLNMEHDRSCDLAYLYTPYNLLYNVYMQSQTTTTLIRTILLKILTRESNGGTKGLLGEPRLEENLGSKLGAT